MSAGQKNKLGEPRKRILKMRPKLHIYFLQKRKIGGPKLFLSLGLNMIFNPYNYIGFWF